VMGVQKNIYCRSEDLKETYASKPTASSDHPEKTNQNKAKHANCTKHRKLLTQSHCQHRHNRTE
jgi:hypothetical protein